jgi:hypothetical protein
MMVFADMPNTRAPDFRFIFANTFAIQFTANESQIKFGVAEDAAKPDDSVIEQVGIVLTPAGVKLLARLLSTTVDNFERDAGVSIPVPTSDEINAIVRQGTQVTGAKKR